MTEQPSLKVLLAQREVSSLEGKLIEYWAIPYRQPAELLETHPETTYFRQTGRDDLFFSLARKVVAQYQTFNIDFLKRKRKRILSGKERIFSPVPDVLSVEYANLRAGISYAREHPQSRESITRAQTL